jgi:hydrogenase maturation protease
MRHSTRSVPRLALSSPIVLGDFPELGKKTEADAFDATEIDELLTLSVLSLSDAERAEARATDPRARAIVDRAERFGAGDIARLHDGELSRFRSGRPGGSSDAAFRWRHVDPRSRELLVDSRNDPFAAADVEGSRAAASVDPFEPLPPASVVVNGVPIEKGSSVRLRPKRRADAWDTFLAGKDRDGQSHPSGFRRQDLRGGDRRRRSGERSCTIGTAARSSSSRMKSNRSRQRREAANPRRRGRQYLFQRRRFRSRGPAPAAGREADRTDAHVEDYGIRGLHLAYELLNGYEAAVLVDAVPRNDAPGTLYVIEPSAPEPTVGAPDAHRMDLSNVFAFLRMLGGQAPPITIVGCEPATVEEGIGLSPAVANAVESALPLVRRVVNDVLSRKETPWSEALS